MLSPTDSAHIHVQVDRSLHTRALKLIPWGLRSEMFRKVLEVILDAIERHGQVMIGALISGRIRIVYEEEKDVKGNSRR